MNLEEGIQSLYNTGFNSLYPIYGTEIDIVSYGSGIPYLMEEGDIEEVETGIEALMFPLSKREKEEYGTSYADDMKKFLFTTIEELYSGYLIRVGDDKYEIFNIVNRTSYGSYRVIAKKSEDV